jgi:hypothetical protein
MTLKIKKILVSQPKPSTEKSPYFDISAKYNVKIDFRPFIKVDPILAKEFRAQRIVILDIRQLFSIPVTELTIFSACATNFVLRCPKK